MQIEKSADQKTAFTSSSDVISPDDPRYNDYNSRGFNQRFKGHPQFIKPVRTSEQLVQAIQEAVTADQRLAIRNGGHCLENFVDDPEVMVAIDMSMMKGVRFDPEMKAFEVMAGTTVGEMYEKMFNGWGVFLPVGEHPAIGIGGHIPGGAFGFLCRQYGLAVDYLYAVEMAWVNEQRKVELVVATSETDDPNHELWWAHTGGGAGNFGIVTRFWFKVRETISNEPSSLLPRAPSVIETLEVDWKWEHFTEIEFTRLVSNFGKWCENNSAPDDAGSGLFCTLHLWRQKMGKLQLKGLLTTEENANAIAEHFIAAVTEGINQPYSLVRKKMDWLEFALRPFPDIFTEGKAAFKLKDAFLRKAYTAAQVKIVYNYLTRTDYDVPGGFIGHATYGGKVNVVAPHATATFQRNVIMTTACTAGWVDAKDEAENVQWARNCYKELFADTGGVPVPGERTNGSMINHPDSDLADPAWNTSMVPWHTLYYGSNYPRLQQVKAKWDPCNIFHHVLSVQP